MSCLEFLIFGPSNSLKQLYVLLKRDCVSRISSKQDLSRLGDITPDIFFNSPRRDILHLGEFPYKKC